METYLYECLHRYDPSDHNHGVSYILIEPGDRIVVNETMSIQLSGTFEQPMVSKSLQSL